MIDFAAYAIAEPPPEQRQELIDRLWRAGGHPVLVLNTCQRLEVYGYHHPDIDRFGVTRRWTAQEAFTRLTRIATGLESRVLGELEVMGQVRTAFRAFKQLTDRPEHRLERTFNDIIALARKARRESGIDARQTSLSGLACRHLLNQLETPLPIAVIGSGSLATSVIRYLGKRGNSPVRVSSRCPEKAIQLAIQAGGFGASLDDLTHLLDGVGGIIAATAAPHPVLYAHHLDAGDHPIHVVDLGVPQDCSPCLQFNPRVRYTALEAIESTSEGNKEQRRAAAARAETIIRQGAEAWANR